MPKPLLKLHRPQYFCRTYFIYPEGIKDNEDLLRICIRNVNPEEILLSVLFGAVFKFGIIYNRKTKIRNQLMTSNKCILFDFALIIGLISLERTMYVNIVSLS